MSRLMTLVELRGLEPLTPTLPVWCATSCATAPYFAATTTLVATESQCYTAPSGTPDTAKTCRHATPRPPGTRAT
jgi:hypothetical protein